MQSRLFWMFLFSNSTSITAAFFFQQQPNLSNRVSGLGAMQATLRRAKQ
jgi:hypothetical protein